MPLAEPIYNPKPNLGGGTNAALGAKLSDPAFAQSALDKVQNSPPPIPKDPIEILILFFTKSTATLQVGIFKILWGKATNPPIKASIRDPQTGEVKVVQTAIANTGQKISNFFQSGLFNILDTINGLDLCSILSFLTTTTNSRPRPRPAKPWTKEQEVLFFIQDKAKLAQDTIDKYLALPTSLVRSYVGIEPQVVTPQQAVSGSNTNESATDLTGTNAQRFNVYSLLQALKDAFTVNGQNSIISAEDATILSQVPGLGNSLNFIDDFIAKINQYTDYRNINNQDLQKLLKQIDNIRSICVTIQTLDFSSILATVGNFLGVDVRAQIQQLSKIVDPTKLLPTIKQIANQVNGFVKVAQRTYNILTQLQFIIKLAIILTRIFTFIEVFFVGNPLPALFTTSGVQAAFNKAREAATNGRNKVIRRLEQVNGLLSVLISFVRYLLASSTELLVKLQITIRQLEACETTKDSAVLLDLKASYADLKQVQEQLATYIAIHDGKTSPDTATFGDYSIRVVDEELTDKSITNKRRRGIAVDQSGAIVVQSDLTFATNTSIIIEETKLKLVSQGLVASQFSTFANPDLAVIFQAAQYLENDDVLSEDFNFDNLTSENVDPPDGTDESQGLGLNAFINNLSGGRRLRKRTRKAMENSSNKFKQQVSQNKVDGNRVLNTDNVASSVGTGNETGAAGTGTGTGTLTAQQRKNFIRLYRSGDPIGKIIARKKLEEDEKAGGPGRKADPQTGLAKTQ